MRSSNKLKLIFGFLLAFFGPLLGSCFYFFLAVPSKTQLPDGTYGEMYGPVVYFEMPVYIACWLSFVIGLSLMFVRRNRHKVNSKYKSDD